MKPENLAGIQGSRTTPALASLEKSLKLSLEAQTGGAVVLHCQGRIIFGPEARALTEIVAQVLPSSRRMVLDLAEVESVDSAGLGELVLLHMWAEAAGYALKCQPAQVCQAIARAYKPHIGVRRVWNCGRRRGSDVR